MLRLIPFLLALFLLSPALAQEPSGRPPFGQWLTGFKQDAREQGITQETLDDAFAATQPIDRVVELDRSQPESLLTLQEYLRNTVTPKRIQEGRKLLAENRSLLKKIAAEYGVQPRFIVALWGIETSYGRNTGGFSTVDALATLAYEGRRSEFFREELLTALKIIQDEQMHAADMKGSWAGALGQCQFMPSTYIKYAVDYDEDGKRDIWTTKADAFASIAHYLSALGWDAHAGWGRRVKLRTSFDAGLADIKKERTLSQWKKLGVKISGGSRKASLIIIGEEEDAAPYLIYSNYKALLKWNRSRFFATAVGTLADSIGK